MTMLTVITRSVKASKLSDERWEERGKLRLTEDIEEEEKIRRKRKDTAKDKEGKKGKMSVGTEGVKGEAGRTERWALAHTRAIHKKFMYQKHKATAASSRP